MNYCCLSRDGTLLDELHGQAAAGQRPDLERQRVERLLGRVPRLGSLHVPVADKVRLEDAELSHLYIYCFLSRCRCCAPCCSCPLRP